MKIARRLFCYKCSYGELAKILGASSGYVEYLKNIGVIIEFPSSGKIWLCKSLRAYFTSYLPPWRTADIAAETIQRLSTPPEIPTRGLKICLQLKAEIARSILRLHALEVLNTITHCRAAIAAVKQNLQNLRDWLLIEQHLLRRKIRRAGLPVKVELILESRYVDCQPWKEICFYSPRQTYRLHRQGLKMIFGD